MKIRLDHVAVAVSDIKQAIDAFEASLGIECEKTEEVPTESAQVAFFDLGGPHLELVQPTSEDSAMGKSLQKRGEGLHHICLEVENIEIAMAAMKSKGIRLINDEPRPGANNSKICFVHPKSMNGVLIELVEKP
ncbi:MAG: methylmalonyl-CoA epimerase [Myxococcota bacterium]|nr:methylmalonyl-CoA epimerase [Myxococcota bacterium]